MARDGQKIFDSDTHVGPSMDVLENYMSVEDRGLLAPYADYRRVNERSKQVTYQMGVRSYRRRLGEISEDMGGGYLAGFTGSHKGRDPSPDVDHDAHSRIADLEIEGIDVNLTLPSGWFGAWTAIPEVDLEIAAYAAYHRWMADYCGTYPDRLGGVILFRRATFLGASRSSIAVRRSDGPGPCSPTRPRGCRSTTPISSRSGKLRKNTTSVSFSIPLLQCPPMLPAVSIPGATSSSSGLLPTHGAGCGTWHRSSVPE